MSQSYQFLDPIIINCIAIASHEKCEDDPKEAYKINSDYVKLE